MIPMSLEGARRLQRFHLRETLSAARARRHETACSVRRPRARTSRRSCRSRPFRARRSSSDPPGGDEPLGYLPVEGDVASTAQQATE